MAEGTRQAGEGGSGDKPEKRGGQDAALPDEQPGQDEVPRVSQAGLAHREQPGGIHGKAGKPACEGNREVLGRGGGGGGLAVAGGLSQRWRRYGPVLGASASCGNWATRVPTPKEACTRVIIDVRPEGWDCDDPFWS